MFFLIIIPVIMESIITDMAVPIMNRPRAPEKAKTDIAAAIPIVKTARKQNAELFCVANRLYNAFANDFITTFSPSVKNIMKKVYHTRNMRVKIYFLQTDTHIFLCFC